MCVCMEKLTGGTSKGDVACNNSGQQSMASERVFSPSGNIISLTVAGIVLCTH